MKALRRSRRPARGRTSKRSLTAAGGVIVAGLLALALPAAASAANTIVYAHGGDIWTADETGAGARQISPGDGPWRWRFQPTLSFDGRVAYAAQSWDGVGGSELDELVIVSPDDSAETVLYSRLNDYLEGPAFSPDGRKLIFGRFGLDTHGFDLYKLNLDAPQAPPVAVSTLPGDETPAAFSPDGTQIAFGYNGSVQIADADGGGRRALATPGLSHAGVPQWRPDGRALVFEAWPSTSANQYDIYTINVDGTGLRPLTTSSVTDLNPEWSPDGQTILFQRGWAGTIRTSMPSRPTGRTSARSWQLRTCSKRTLDTR